MYKSKIFRILVTCLLLSCAILPMFGCISDEAEMRNLTKLLGERKSGWPIPDEMDALAGVYLYNLTSEEVQKIGLSAITDISDCEAQMEFYKDGAGRIALSDERSKGANHTSEAYDLEWYAEKIDPKDLSIDIDQDYSDCYRVQIAFCQHFDIDFKGEYIFIQTANDSYVYEYGTARYDYATDWLINKSDSAADENLSISTIKLK